jgi:hypothetical protein
MQHYTYQCYHAFHMFTPCPPPEQVAGPQVPQVEVPQDAPPDGGGVDGQHLGGAAAAAAAAGRQYNQ